MDNSAPFRNEAFWEKLFYFCLASGWVIRIFIALSLDLSPDEAYYWELSRHPALSYFDHPPMVAYCIAAGRFFFGDTPLAVRLPALLFHPITTWLVFLLGKRLPGGNQTGFFGALFMQITVAGNTLGFITTPDVPLSLAWAVSAYALIRCLADHRLQWWILLGMGLGCGAMAKYNMIFFVPGALIIFLVLPEHRRVFSSSHLWLAAGLAALGTFPVLYWNSQNEWISFQFQLSHGFRKSGLNAFSCFAEYLGGQLVTIGPLLFPLLFFTEFSALKNWRNQGERLSFALAAIAMPMMAFFALNSFRSKVEANWPKVAYLTVMPLVAEWLLTRPQRKWLWWVAGTSACLMALSLFQAATLGLPINPKQDVSTRLHGWTEYGKLVQENDLRLGGKGYFFAQGAPFAAITSFYGKLPPDRIGEVNGSGNWKFWWRDRQLPVGASAVFLDYSPYPEVPSVGPRFFDKIVASETVPIVSRGKLIRKINFTNVTGYRGGPMFNSRGLIPASTPVDPTSRNE
mgnify:CR=1 FL=1